MTLREQLIGQLRYALHLAESRDEECVEFEIGDTSFCFDLLEETVND